MIFESKKELREALYNADERCGKHFMKLVKIERIINEGQAKKRLYADMIEDIKMVLASDQTY